MKRVAPFKRVGLAAAFTAIAIVAPASTPSIAQPATGLAQVFEFAKPAVVYVVVATSGGAQSGSGFVMSSDATSSTIITANHVVEGGTEIDVIFDSNKQERYPAKVVRRDHIRDVAVLKVNVGGRRSLPLEPGADIKEGMSIAVIGYPRATLQFFQRVEGDALRPSIHSGIVSAIRLNGEVIQFDATVDHGDSGGPIIDATNGNVIAIVRGSPLDQTYVARGLEQPLPGSAFGPSSSTISLVMNAEAGAALAQAPVDKLSAGTGAPVGGQHVGTSAGVTTSASYRLGYGVPRQLGGYGDQAQVAEIDEAVNSSVLDRLANFLKGENELYLIPLTVTAQAVNDPQHLSGFCDDQRLNALAIPIYTWSLSGGPRVNAYGRVIGYNGEARVQMSLLVLDCFGIPFFSGSEQKSENRHFAHRTPDREVVDMANDLLDKLMQNFAQVRDTRQGAWQNLLKVGIDIDPSDPNYHIMASVGKKPDGWHILSVAPNGPADQAGLRLQDIVVKIDGTDVSGLSLSELTAKLNVPQFTIEVQRPGGIVTLTVHPMRYAEIVHALQH